MLAFSIRFFEYKITFSFKTHTNKINRSFCGQKQNKKTVSDFLLQIQSNAFKVKNYLIRQTKKNKA